MARKIGKKPPGKGAVSAAPGRVGEMGKAAVRRGKEPALAGSGRADEIARTGNLLVLGSVALDSVKTPFGEVGDVLGGSAAFFATAASYFTAVSMIAVVGEDFPERHLNFLRQRNIDLTGLERRPGKTFRWRGEYSYQLNEAKTIATHLNVFETFRPVVPESHREPEMLFLANIDPELQRTVLEQVRRPRLVACASMNFWIDGK